MMSDQKRVVVTGATGLIGRPLCAHLCERGYAVTIFSRSTDKARQTLPGMADYVAWQAEEHGAWERAIDGAHAVINLAGASLFSKRWTEKYKRVLWDSRVVGTRGLVNAMRAASARPAVFISGSAVGYYGARDDTVLPEEAAPGNDFLAKLCVAWEQEAFKAKQLGVRVATIRTGIVLDADEGALPLMKLPFTFFAGGYILPGTQWFPWIHIADEVGIILKTLDDADVRGPVNASAPHPQTNADFMRTLGRVMGRPAWVPVPGFALRLALGAFADSLTTGPRAIPEKITEHGYTFTYPTSEAALRDLVG
jgi:uncharacterized protein (TIGR01777 family)